MTRLPLNMLAAVHCGTTPVRRLGGGTGRDSGVDGAVAQPRENERVPLFHPVVVHFLLQVRNKYDGM